MLSVNILQVSSGRFNFPKAQPQIRRAVKANCQVFEKSSISIILHFKKLICVAISKATAIATKGFANKG